MTMTRPIRTFVLVIMASILLTMLIITTVKVIQTTNEITPYKTDVENAAEALNSTEYLAWQQLWNAPDVTWSQLESSWGSVQSAWHKKGIVVTLQNINEIKNQSTYNGYVHLGMFESRLKNHIDYLVKDKQLKLNELNKHRNHLAVSFYYVLGNGLVWFCVAFVYHAGAKKGKQHIKGLKKDVKMREELLEDLSKEKKQRIRLCIMWFLTL